MATYWCVNFDYVEVLQNGLAQDCWLMQYQYSHGGFDFQGHSAQIAATTKNWNLLREIDPGDQLIAYVKHSMFYGIGEVIEPRKSRIAKTVDTVERTVREHRHLQFDGIVLYEDAPVLYEDFTDSWSLPAARGLSRQPKSWKYPQRIDVAEWQHIVPEGVAVDGLSGAAPFPQYRQAAFRITKSFFKKVTRELEAACAAMSA